MYPRQLGGARAHVVIVRAVTGSCSVEIIRHHAIGVLQAGSESRLNGRALAG